jgi:hypothetical protein
MPTTTSQSHLAVLPLESSIPPEMTLNEWRHRHVEPAANRPPQVRVVKRAGLAFYRLAHGVG